VIGMPAANSPVIVGVDGSDESVPVLRWAAFEALRRDTVLVAVHAFGSTWRPAPYAPTRVSLSADSAAAHAITRLDRCLRKAFDGRPPVAVRTVCDSRPPVPALLDQGTGAAMLVLGARSDPVHGGAMLGPIARDCLRRTPCPVALLPATVDIDHVTETPVDA
jgi:nucleotide-binding universal stress UspA family protein